MEYSISISHTMKLLLPFTVLFLACFVSLSEQHARLMEPPSRASMWRVGFPTPKDIDDNQSYCGGIGNQISNGGRCGICGDPWDEYPRAHEAPGGIYATGIITKTYKQGSFIPVIIDITANHQGYFVFKLCANNDIFQDPKQACFDANPLWVGGGDPKFNQTRYPINDYVTGLRMVYVRLPMKITCDQCILQWSYVAGNNWGKCEDGTSGMGCGPQETFRSCADIKIVFHPLLMSMATKGGWNGNSLPEEQQEDTFYDISVLENELASSPSSPLSENSGLGDGISDGSHKLHHQKLASIRRKEALLRRKKTLLKQLIKKLRLLIQQSERDRKEDGTSGSGSGSGPDQMTSPNKMVVSQIIPQEKDKSLFYQKEYATPNAAHVKPWWERIMSNKH